ncbi:MAG: Ku protein [Acidobacteriota bacterium]
MPARSIDTATIAFGLVSIPVKLYSTSEHSHEIHFHLIHDGCGERLEQRYACPIHGEVPRDQIAKGFEISKGNFVELSKEELEALAAIDDGELAIREFVPAKEVDPIYVDRTYYLGPGRGGERAYRLLRDALEDAKIVGIASYVARGKQYVVMLRAFEDGLAIHQLRYTDEVKPWSEVPLGRLPKPTPSELALARQVVDQLRHDTFDPGHYEDEVKDRVRELIAKKAKGGKIVAPPEAPEPVVTDLMEALKASLGEASPETNGHAKHGHRRSARTHARPHHGKRHATSSASRHHGR